MDGTSSPEQYNIVQVKHFLKPADIDVSFMRTLHSTFSTYATVTQNKTVHDKAHERNNQKLSGAIESLKHPPFNTDVTEVFDKVNIIAQSLEIPKTVMKKFSNSYNR